MQRNNTYDIAKCWAIVSVIVYHVINIGSYIPPDPKPGGYNLCL